MRKKSKQSNEDSWFSEIAAAAGGEVLEDVGVDRGFIDTNVLSLNHVVSGKFVGGGIPSGTICEIYGPSSTGKSLLAMNIIRGVQDAGGIGVYLDAERAVNKDFAKKASRVNANRLIVLYPDTLKEAFNKIHSIIQKIRQNKDYDDKPVCIVYDSIAVSPSDEEFNETTIDMETATDAEKKRAGVRNVDQPGSRAKTAARELRKLMPVVAENNVTVIVINQLRNKIGIMYGCFSYLSKVLLADGTWEKIGKIVNNKLPVSVLSYNQQTGKVETKKVIGWHNNGLIEPGTMLSISFDRPFDNGSGFMNVTKNHKVFVKRNGEIVEEFAGNIQIGDNLCLALPRRFSKSQMQIVYGGLLGDGNIRRVGSHNAVFRMGHGPQQKNYFMQKYEWLSNLCGKIKDTVGKKIYSSTVATAELNNLSEYVQSKMIPQEVADRIDEFGLAVWYMDDGNYSGHHEVYGFGKSVIYCKKFKNKEIMVPVFKKYGIEVTVKERGFVFDAENTDRFHRLIARFVPESMQYKLHPRYHGLFGCNVEKLDQIDWIIEERAVTKIAPATMNKLRYKYDLTVEDNSTYFVGGALVHNSPLTTAGGGESLKYYCSTRVEINAAKSIKDKRDRVLGMETKFKTTKSRHTAPHQKVEGVRLDFERGIDPFGGLLGSLLRLNRIEGNKGRYTVREPWAGGQEVKFSSSAESGRVPLDILLRCPSLIDADTPEKVSFYSDLYGAAIEAAEDGDVVMEDMGQEDE